MVRHPTEDSRCITTSAPPLPLCLLPAFPLSYPPSFPNPMGFLAFSPALWCPKTPPPCPPSAASSEAVCERDSGGEPWGECDGAVSADRRRSPAPAAVVPWARPAAPGGSGPRWHPQYPFSAGPGLWLLQLHSHQQCGQPCQEDRQPAGAMYVARRGGRELGGRQGPCPVRTTSDMGQGPAFFFLVGDKC